MTKITDIEIYILKPGAIVSISYGQNILWETNHSGVIKISTDDDVYGSYIASADCLKEFANRFSIQKDVIINADILDRERTEKELATKYRWSNSILSVLDACLWDAIGKTLNYPIYKLLGGYREKILAYASEIEWALSTIQDHVTLAIECKKKGFKAFKIHPPHQSWKEDVKLCKAIREAVGDDMILMFDPYSHEHYDREAAIKVGRILEELNFYWYEDPLPTNDIHGLSNLCKSLDIKILIGEYVSNIGGYTMLIENEATDSLRCVDGLIGGISSIMKVFNLAEAFDMKCEPHSYGPVLMQAAHLHTMLSNNNCDFFELPVPDGIYDRGMKEVIKIDNEGYVNAPKKPGLGYEIDWDYVKDNTIEILPK
jgi:L-alanine-DL-glutamate epimerase-like enolase superfamily enzyme